jgi:[protein-PII] uridylyltransferase
MIAAALREQRRKLDDDRARRGKAYGSALADAVDVALRGAFDESSGCALVALGSYARRELCPGSDLDVLLVLPTKRRFRRDVDQSRLAEGLWYPLWDAGFTTGHGARSIADSVVLAGEDLDALTAMMHVRLIAGDAELAAELERSVRALAQQRQNRLLRQLADGVASRRARPGAIAEMLDPNLKDGGGGLRDLHALVWANVALGGDDDVALDALVRCSALAEVDTELLVAARERLLELRVALHRVNGGKSDLLVLQDQDAVAAAEGVDADTLVRELAQIARDVSWIVAEAMQALTPSVERVVDRELGPNTRVRADRIEFTTGRDPSALDVLDAAAHSAELGVGFERATLDAFARMTDPTWDVWERAAFGRVLRAGRRAVPVFEALDHAGVLVRLLPEWAHVRSLPQRNAYHRFTVDRHLLEAVAECVDLLDLADAPEPRPFDGVVARACRRPELLLLGALFHDIGKGLPGDHSKVGAEITKTIARRMHLDSEGIEILVWLARDHLLMADTATRRDLSDTETVRRFADALAGDPERLRLLYLLTIGDSIATGAAAWSRAKAALCRDLFVKAAAFVEEDSAAPVVDARRSELAARVGAAATDAFLGVMPSGYVLAFEPDVMASHQRLVAERRAAVVCETDADGRLVVTVAAPDRSGLLATVAGALTICGLAVLDASLFSTVDGMAIDVFRAEDTFRRAAERGLEWVASVLQSALDGDLDVNAGVAERRRYQASPTVPGPVDIRFDLDASNTATVVEVHCDDRLGLLHQLASTFAAAGVDVSVAKVQTLAERVIDTFYIRDRDGRISDPVRLAAIEAALRSALSGSG